MALPIFSTIPPMTKVSLSTNMQVGGVSQFRGYTFLGIQPYAIARAMSGQDPTALVTATRAYFRVGSEIDPNRVSFVALRKDDASPIILIPEPLIQENSISQTSKVTHVIRVDGDYSREQLSVILSTNGVGRFTIETEVV